MSVSTLELVWHVRRRVFVLYCHSGLNESMIATWFLVVEEEVADTHACEIHCNL